MEGFNNLMAKCGLMPLVVYSYNYQIFAVINMHVQSLHHGLPLSMGHTWCIALQSLFLQSLTMSTGWKIQGVIKYDKPSCP